MQTLNRLRARLQASEPSGARCANLRKCRRTQSLPILGSRRPSVDTRQHCYSRARW
jgi:hypothetical protein